MVWGWNGGERPGARVALGLMAAVGAVLAVSAGAAPASRPNIVLIVSDDQGYRDLGCFGGPVVRTPNLDRIASEGVRLTSFYVAWPACTPSRASLLTGRYPQRNGLYDMIRNDVTDYGRRMDEYEYAVSPEMTLGLDTREITLAQVLGSGGYATGIVGKWDSGRARRFLPLQRGFDSFYGFANTGIDYWTHERYGVPSLFRGNERITEEGYATHLFRREALRFIEAHRDRPFFLYVAFNAPHAASNLEKDSWQVPESALRAYEGHDPNSARTKYMACVSEMDAAIGSILEALDRHELAERTLVFFCSDNGGGGRADNAPLRGRKAQMFEGGLRVPALARWPGVVPAGSTTDAFLTALEVFPTVLAAAGVPAPGSVTLDGFDMAPVLRGERPSPRQEMFWERRGDRAARVGSWKWVDSAAGSGLFDLAEGPSESHNRAADQPGRLDELKARFAAWKRTMDAAEPRGPFRDY